MFRKIIFLTATFMTLSVIFIPDEAFAAKRKKQQTRTMSTVKREQQAAQKSIKEDGKKLTDNTRRTQQGLMRLSQLEGELQEKSREIDNVRSSLETIDSDIKLAGDSLKVLEQNLNSLRSQYAKALRKMQGSFRSKNLLTFLFSAKNFSDVSARYRYLKEFSNWRKRKMQEISDASKQIGSQKELLGTLQSKRLQTLTTLTENESQLRDKKNETDRMVTKLKKEGSRLQKAIDNNQKKLKRLDNELDRMIVAEQKRQAEIERRANLERQKKNRKTATNKSDKRKGRKETSSPKKTSPPALASGNAQSRALSGSFESNRGRLLFPVRGKYTIVRGFGRQKHPDLPNVVTDNPGIDIAASNGAMARSIFEGTVSGVFAQDGYNKVVMVRHGSYISIYANLSSINVKVGEKVKANQNLGSIYQDPDYGNKPVLHFELRRERNKLNPLQWVR